MTLFLYVPADCVAEVAARGKCGPAGFARHHLALIARGADTAAGDLAPDVLFACCCQQATGRD
jgi:hypothetical protein